MKTILSFLLISNLAMAQSNFVSTIISPKADIQFYGKNNGVKSISDLITYTEKKGRTLIFAMNGGMYYEDYSPMGLFVQKGKVVKAMNNRKAKTNFYTSPGVFYLKEGRAFVCSTSNYPGGAYFATQSGPMLVSNGKIDPSFTQGSSHTNIRNGVGILPDGRILFAISKYGVNFYDFAEYFKEQGCMDALFMDGCISAMYLNGKYTQYDGYFGVVIGVTK